MQLVADSRGVRWIDDSKGTNVGATVAAVRGLEGRSSSSPAGSARAQDFTPLAAALQRRARAVVLIGAERRASRPRSAGCCRIEHATSMEDAVRRAAALAEPGDAVLLSPACASQDMFVTTPTAATSSRVPPGARSHERAGAPRATRSIPCSSVRWARCSLLGLVAVASASMALAERDLGRPFYYLTPERVRGRRELLALVAFVLPTKLWRGPVSCSWHSRSPCSSSCSCRVSGTR